MDRGIPQTVPIDVWRIIFDLACTDTGRTGATLSRVCKGFCETLTPYRFRYVCLSKLQSIENFVECFELVHSAAVSRGDGADLPQVRRLLLSFLPGETDAEPVPSLLLGPLGYLTWRDKKVEWNTRFVRCMTRLFALIAPRLEALTVLQSPLVPLPFVRCTLPALRELTLLQDDRLFLRLADDPCTSQGWPIPSDTDFYGVAPPPDLAGWAAAAPPFPALTSLHLVLGDLRNPQWRTTIPAWAALAPRLARLCVSNAGSPILAAVGALLHARPPAFPTLDQVTLQVALTRFRAEYAHLENHSKDEGKRRARAPDVKVLDSICDVDRTSYWPERLTDEWFAKLPAGRG
ncbi:hypothetical protein BD413DRAFT_493669 [Trametes elegans]|nr:hypothetical protein BD413DRAFT_493669 [Trametes elegans]